MKTNHTTDRRLIPAEILQALRAVDRRQVRRIAAEVSPAASALFEIAARTSVPPGEPFRFSPLSWGAILSTLDSDTRTISEYLEAAGIRSEEIQR